MIEIQKNLALWTCFGKLNLCVCVCVYRVKMNHIKNTFHTIRPPFPFPQQEAFNRVKY